MGIAEVRLPTPTEGDRQQLQTTLRERVAELNEEASMFGDPAPTPEAIGHLRVLAEAMLPWVMARRLPLPTVFLRDGGTLEVVVTNPPISRRLTAHLSTDGATYMVYLTDGRGQARDPARGHSGRPLETSWMEWLCP